jgi:hypothetical protein
MAAGVRTGPYVRPRSVRFLAGLVLLVGAAAGLGGPVYAIGAGTRAGAHVTVPVRLAEPGRSDASTGAEQAPLPPGLPQLPPGSTVLSGSPDLVVRSWDSTVAEQLLSRGDAAVIGLALGLGAVLLRTILLSVAGGRPFRPGDARRIAALAVLVGLAGTLGPVLPQVAGMLVLDRLGVAGPDGPDSPFLTGVSFPLLPLLVAPVLLALAEAFRRGAELAADVDGLV